MERWTVDPYQLLTSLIEAHITRRAALWRKYWRVSGQSCCGWARSEYRTTFLSLAAIRCWRHVYCRACARCFRWSWSYAVSSRNQTLPDRQNACKWPCSVKNVCCHYEEWSALKKWQCRCHTRKSVCGSSSSWRASAGCTTWEQDCG